MPKAGPVSGGRSGVAYRKSIDGYDICRSRAAAEYQGPVYIRLTGGRNNPIVYERDYDFAIGKAVTLREGGDLTLIATGAMVAQALNAAGILKEKGLAARVVDMHTIKPLDVEAIRRAAAETRLVATVEEHSILGGLGGAVGEVMAEIGGAPKLVRIGLPDRFGPIGTYAEQLERYGLTGPQICATVLSYLGRS